MANTTLTSDITKLIEKAIQQEVEEAITIEIEAAKERVEKKVRENLGKIVLGVLKHYSVTEDMDQIRITVRNDFKM